MKVSPGPGGGRSLKVVLYSGIVVEHDAVSHSLGYKLDILRRLRDQGAPIELTVFTLASDQAAPEIRPLPSVATLTAMEEFWDADVHMFEFGMYYDLFDALFLIAPDRPILVIEHNTTPPALVDIPEVKIGCERSMIQRYNLIRARHVACVSEFNLQIARSVGVPEERLSVLHLPPAHVSTHPARTEDGRRRGAPVRLLFVGRFVRSKGVLDLLEMAEGLWGQGQDVALTLVGNPRFSDPAVMEAIEHALARHGASGALELVTSPDNAEMVALFERSDCLVIPSYHEGYCVPVIEAYTAGCQVVAYDAGNLPNIVGGLGQVVTTGDVHALTNAASAVVGALGRSRSEGTPLIVPTSSGGLAEAQWRAAVSAHTAAYSAPAYEREFLRLFAELAGASPCGLDEHLESLVAGRREELAHR